MVHMGHLFSFIHGLIQRKPALAKPVEATADIVATGGMARHLPNNASFYVPGDDPGSIDFVGMGIDRWAALANMDDRALWKALAERWRAHPREGEEKWPFVLDVAGSFGCLAPFEVVDRSSMLTYTIRAFASWRSKACHPRVGLWLVQQGRVKPEDLRAQINTKTFPLAGTSFAAMESGVPVRVSYLQEWCVSYLRDYGLSQAQKTLVVGQALRSFGADVWRRHLASVCEPVMGVIDVPLLATVCAVPGLDQNGDDLLTAGIALLAQDPHALFDPRRFDEHVGQCPHLGVQLMAQARGVETRLDLYFLALQVKALEGDGPEQDARIALPTLD